MNKLTTLEMEIALANYFDLRRNIIVPNISWGFHIHECDLLIIRPSGYLVEVEIKISLADLKKDQKKYHGHRDRRIKALYFAIPEYLQSHVSLIPQRAGVLVLKEKSYFDCPDIIKQELKEYKYLKFEPLRKPLINTNADKIDERTQLKIARLGTLRIWSLKRKLLKFKQGGLK